ncbi:MAG: hypothetical protein ACXV2E_08940 [Halobacteriota archaeon]
MQNGHQAPPRSHIPFLERKAANDFRGPFFMTDREHRRRLQQGKGDFGRSQLPRKFFSALDDDELSESGIPSILNCFSDAALTKLRW